jgi:hypothetical protein
LQGLHWPPEQVGVIMTPGMRIGKQLSPAAAPVTKSFRRADAGKRMLAALSRVIADAVQRGRLP